MLVPAIDQVFSTVQNIKIRAKNLSNVEKANTKVAICGPRPWPLFWLSWLGQGLGKKSNPRPGPRSFPSYRYRLGSVMGLLWWVYCDGYGSILVIKMWARDISTADVPLVRRGETGCSLCVIQQPEVVGCCPEVEDLIIRGCSAQTPVDMLAFEVTSIEAGVWERQNGHKCK